MSKKRCRRGHRNRSAVSVTRITVDVGHPNQVNPHRCQSPKLPQNVRFSPNPTVTKRSQNLLQNVRFSPNPTVTKRSQNRRSRVPNPSRASIAVTQPLKHVKTWKNEVINSTKIEQVSRISTNGDDRHAQKLFVNIVDSVCVCSVIVLCAQLMDLSRHMVLAGGQVAGFSRKRSDRWRPQILPQTSKCHEYQNSVGNPASVLYFVRTFYWINCCFFFVEPRRKKMRVHRSGCVTVTCCYRCYGYRCNARRPRRVVAAMSLDHTRCHDRLLRPWPGATVYRSRKRRWQSRNFRIELTRLQTRRYSDASFTKLRADLNYEYHVATVSI